jgi:hypothetical protein
MPYRAAVVVALCLALLTSIGLARIGRLLTRKKRYALCVIAGIVILAETRFVSPVPFPLPSQPAAAPEVYRHLAESDGCGAVLDVPSEAHGLSVGANLELIYYQLHHGRPSLVHFLQGSQGSKRTLFDHELTARCGGSQVRNLLPEENTTLLDFEYLVLHERRLEPSALETVRAFLDDNMILDQIYGDEGIRLYRTIESEVPLEAGALFRRRPGLADICDESPAEQRLVP